MIKIEASQRLNAAKATAPTDKEIKALFKAMKLEFPDGIELTKNNKTKSVTFTVPSTFGSTLKRTLNRYTKPSGNVWNLHLAGLSVSLGKQGTATLVTVARINYDDEFGPAGDESDLYEDRQPRGHGRDD